LKNRNDASAEATTRHPRTAFVTYRQVETIDERIDRWHTNLEVVLE
jgi:hypothetical protein